MDDLDTPGAGFSVDPDEGGASKLPFIAVLIGVVGILLGGAGVYLAMQAKSELEGYKADLAAQGDPTAAALERIEAEFKAKFDDMDGRLGNIGGSIVRLQRQGASAEVAKQIQDLHTQTQAAFDKVSGEVQTNRARLNEATDKLDRLAARVGGGAVAAPAAATRAPTPGASETASPTTTVAGMRVHTVQPGETLDSIRRQYGLTLAELMAANPGVDPRRMQIGQEIVIPGN